MLDYCGEEIDMVSQDVYTGRLSIDGAFAGDCNATIETWYSADKLMFYFENFNFPENVDGCNFNYIQVYDKNMMGDYQLMHGKDYDIKTTPFLIQSTLDISKSKYYRYLKSKFSGSRKNTLRYH